ncbi:MAG: redoxin domain-containing protein, partial [Bacteroidetes bacterium]|nr:redoxin domain-containing protein [Bacteroidota bacterium]
MSIQVGQTAPVISLFDTDKNSVVLGGPSDKNTVVLFFPLAFTGVCTAELCNIRDNIASYNNTNAQVIGLSVDS